MPTLIVNSDDFGISVDITEAIVESFERGLISSTTLMANMPGFACALEHCHANAAVRNRVGVHVNLTEGVPLTNAMRRCRRFCDGEGVMRYVRNRPIFRLTREEKEAVHGELSAQVEHLIRHHVHPTHLDSHQHIHTELAIAPICRSVCREFGIRAIRLSRNLGTTDRLRFLYKRIFNWYLSADGAVSTTQCFCSADDFRALMAEGRVAKHRTYEIMVHARYREDGRLADLDGKDLGEKMEPIVGTFCPVSYEALLRS